MMENLTYKIQKFLLIFFCWGLTLSTTVFSINAQAEEPVVVDRIVAVVNDEIVTLYDLNETLKPYEENIQALGYPPEKLRETLFKLRSDVLNKLVDQKLADQQIKKYNLMISMQEIDTTIERIKENRSYTDEDLRAGLAEQGLTIEEYRENLKKQLLRRKLVNREVKSKIVITSVEIEKYYNEHREKYAGEIKYHLWNIFIRFSQMTDESQRQIAFGKMETVLSQLKRGRSFESLAAELPESPESPQGTDLGFYLLDELSPQLRNVVKDMKEGEYSPILENDTGYQIIYVQKVLMKDSKSLTDVEAEIEDVLYNEAIDRRYNTWLSELRKRSHIKIVK
ncbi:MAG: SurA N-terminal domain-containing protein [Desulfobacterales bacterium]|jgi:peptidyl-prolyl cis-trans isomerase SurA